MERFSIAIPSQVREALALLNRGGEEAYLVGGCVRDSLLGRSPGDWDITTSALPGRTIQLLSGHRVLETGLRHGTVTGMIGELPVEITTYRVDGGYSDGRHPDQVAFTRSLREDLARRDFTINALAYHPDRGLIDPFGGREDLAAGLVRCVGEPGLRFSEDALRILRGLRFASVLDFTLEEETGRAILSHRELLRQVACERIAVELCKLLCGPGAGKILLRYPQVLGQFIPEILPAVGFEQHNPHHRYDVWQHTCRCVDAAKPIPVLRLAMLLHDLGKPRCFTRDEEGVGHFYNHANIGEEMAVEILRRLRMDNATIHQVALLIRYHLTVIPPEAPAVKRWLGRLGEETFRLLLEVQRADSGGKTPQALARLATIGQVEETLEKVLSGQLCFSRRDLAVGGGDLLALGYPAGPLLGEILSALLDEVVEERLPNDRGALLALAVRRFPLP